MTQTLSNELLDGQRKLLAIAVSGANSKAPNLLMSQLSNGPLGGLHEKVCCFLFFRCLCEMLCNPYKANSLLFYSYLI